ncbi:uncharacterized protein LOC113351991 [Papaver somniferum]|uniref:uncharacterized protein LOC113351991 n=1 Tax=Papaver somniferum TaxID=3469 RepID=UPI000E6F5202|nr:uncharacterized protein LOC113351991 [Papaver somniferum]
MQYIQKSFAYPNYWIRSSVGLSGGLCVLWKDGFHIEIIQEERNLVSFLLQTDASVGKWMLTCIYGAIYDHDNSIQRSSVQNLAHEYNLSCLLLGDLNTTLDASEKQGGTSSHDQKHVYASQIIRDLGFTDVMYSGDPFTWSNHTSGEQLIRVRLDRALVNNECFATAHLSHLLPVGSDHALIMLSTDSVSYHVNKPFRLFEYWLAHTECKNVIAAAWNAHDSLLDLGGISCRLDNTQYALLDWSKSTFGSIQGKIKFIKNKMHCLFHAIANFRRRTNHIASLQSSLAVWCKERDQLEALINSHFQHITTSSNPLRDSGMLDLISPCITASDNEQLLKLPDLEEIKATVAQLPSWKAPGPDGFQTGFYKFCWDVVESEVVDVVQQFFRIQHFDPKLNFAFQTLIPKVECPSTPSDFRPISLCNSIYKIISKIMVNRMKPIIAKIISVHHFVPGRCIQDNIIIAHELLDTMKKKKDRTGDVAVKIDMSKAFDRMEWSFVRDIFHRLGFAEN